MIEVLNFEQVSQASENKKKNVFFSWNSTYLWSIINVSYRNKNN